VFELMMWIVLVLAVMHLIAFGKLYTI